MNSGSETAWLQRFIQLVAMQTGLHIKAQDSEHFRQSIALRMKVLKVSDEREYAHLLETDTAQSKREWEKLALLLTTGESHFCRDKGQLAVLRNSILPELIERRKAPRALRIWSAGCSTGEEPYSLAILVDAMLPQRGDWNICILGTDLNNEAIAQARRGIYRLWSFRMLHPDLQERYFRKRGTDWELDARIRTMVTFRTGNLHKDMFPDHASGMYAMDLIVCRNVFIYFDPSAVSVVVAKFIGTLVGGDVSEAKDLLKKVLYLAPSFGAASLALAALYDKEHDTVRAGKMRATALELRKTLPPDAALEP